ncbi:hypothetical protein BH20PSE1_BH20PSE1_25730 [soil metagenome]
MRILYLLSILAALAGCAIFGDDKEDETADWSAEKLYAEGKESLESEYYTQAVEYYQYRALLYAPRSLCRGGQSRACFACHARLILVK